ncbi:MAG TPA: helix-turn-helix domain-containing protein [Solirubrobacteraceae bacterium]|jgi:excisionase family DNA binding protein
MRIKRKLTIDELAECLALSRSTVYYWVRDLPIPSSGPGGGFAPAASRRGNIAMQVKYRRMREEAYREGLESFAELAEDPTFRDFISLYIAEGFKRNRNVVSIANSDPAVVRFATGWLRRLTDRRPKFYLQYHADQDLDDLRASWAITLDIEPEAIRLQRKSNSNQMTGRIWRCKHGVMTTRLDDTLLRARVQAWMDRLKTDWL